MNIKDQLHISIYTEDLKANQHFHLEALKYTTLNDYRCTLDVSDVYMDVILREEQGQTVNPGYNIHHIAIDMRDDASLGALALIAVALPSHHSGIVDPYFYKSAYYRHHSIMFEYAITGPGFMINTSKKGLGKKFRLSNFPELERVEIENKLSPLR